MRLSLNATLYVFDVARMTAIRAANFMSLTLWFSVTKFSGLSSHSPLAEVLGFECPAEVEAGAVEDYPKITR